MADTKKPSGFQMFLLELALPLLLKYGKDSAQASLQNEIDSDTSEDGHKKNMIKLAFTSVYPVIDTVLEDTALKSKTKVDDKVVADLKSLCEDLADANGWELPNLDDD